MLLKYNCDLKVSVLYYFKVYIMLCVDGENKRYPFQKLLLFVCLMRRHTNSTLEGFVHNLRKSGVCVDHHT